MKEFKQGDYKVGDRVKCTMEHCTCNGEAIVIGFKDYYRKILIKWDKGKNAIGTDTWEDNKGFSKIEIEMKKGRQTLTQTIETEILRIKGGG